MARMIDISTAMDEFDTMVQSELHNYEKLPGTVREYDTQGRHFNIPLYSSLTVNQTDFGTGGIPVSDPAQREVTIQQDNFSLKTVIGKGYETLFAYDVIAGHARQHAQAAARFRDYLKLRALFADDTIFSAANNNLVPVASTAPNPVTEQLSVERFTAGYFQAIDNGVPENMLSYWAPARAMADLTSQDDKFSNWDFNETRPLQHGVGRGYAYLGVPFKILGNAGAAAPNITQSQNTIPDGGTGANAYQRSYLVHMDALALCWNRRINSRVVVEDWEDRVTVITTATAGSHVVHNAGIIQVRSRRSA